MVDGVRIDWLKEPCFRRGEAAANRILKMIGGFGLKKTGTIFCLGRGALFDWG